MASDNDALTALYNKKVYRHPIRPFGSSDATGIASVLRSDSCIMEELNIKWLLTEISDTNAILISTALATNTTVTRVELMVNGLSTKSATSFATTLLTNRRIVHLHLCFNESETVDGGLAFVEAMKTNTTLKKLVIHNISRIRDGNCWADLIKVNSTLNTLWILSYGWESDSTTRLANALAENTTLQSISLGKNNLGDRETTMLASALETNQTLCGLTLNDNGLTSVGMSAIANNLSKYKGLQALKLAHNFIGFDGAAAIAEALSDSNTCPLRIVGLRSCGLGVNEAKILADALKSNQTITKFSVMNNPLTCDGVAFLAKALETNSSLRVLNLTKTQCKGAGAIALAAMLSKNSSLLNLNVSGNKITETGAVVFMNAMQRNMTMRFLGCQDLGPVNGQRYTIEFARHADVQWLHNSEDVDCSTVLRNYCARNILIQIGIRAGSAFSKQRSQDRVYFPVMSTTLFQNNSLRWCFPFTSSNLMYKLLRQQTPQTATWMRVKRHLTGQSYNKLDTNVIAPLKNRKRKAEHEASLTF